jgi:hypothetical protein
LVAIEKLWKEDIRNVPGYREEETETAHGEDELGFWGSVVLPQS